MLLENVQGDNALTIQIFNCYHRLANYDWENSKTELSFWGRKAIQNIEKVNENDPAKVAEKIGLLNGFTGFYKMQDILLTLKS